MRVDETVPRTIRRTGQTLGGEGYETLSVLRTDNLDRRAHVTLQAHRLLMTCPQVVGHQKQVSDGSIPDAVAVLLFEVAVCGKRVERERDVGAARELRPHPGGAGTSGPESGRRLALQNDDPKPSRRQVPRAGGTHDSGTNDGDVG